MTDSDKASAQVAAYAYSPAEAVFYVPVEQNYGLPILHKIPLDGVAAWPL